MKKKSRRQKATDYFREKVRESWKRNAGVGSGLIPGMTWKRYQNSTVVQQKLRAVMGAYNVGGMGVDWNNADFKRQVVDPSVERKAKDLLLDVEAHVGTFADGQPNELLGKRALRATLVPPISMTLSLAMVQTRFQQVIKKANTQ